MVITEPFPSRKEIEAAKSLTETEARLLHLFALLPNETIPRSRLQKELWEEQGVIVGRSMDAFISKLRRKLEAEPKVSIVVIRGAKVTGWRLAHEKENLL